jgi:arylamine N-acetyltransferase
MAPMTPQLISRVLDKLECDAPPPTLPGLTAIYAAWCRKVPFDNIRKLIHVRGGDPGRLPGDTPEEFFEAWLAHGCGGTCWSGNGALHALLAALGFAVERGVATMLVAPDIPPNHGSVVATIDGDRWVVDASILHAEPLVMREGHTSEIPHPAWGVTGSWVDGQFRIRWRNFVTGGGSMDCGFNHVGATADEFSQRHETTRGWSPFNYGVSLNLIRDSRRIGAGMGKLYTLDETGAVSEREVDLFERKRFLVEEIGMSEELIEQLPDDVPMAPPPR